MVSVLAGIVAGTAQADGLPVVGVDVGAEGTANIGSEHRFVALPVGKNTLVARIERGSGKVRATRIHRGHLTIPAVAYDGSAAGVSADGQARAHRAPSHFSEGDDDLRNSGHERAEDPVSGDAEGRLQL